MSELLKGNRELDARMLALGFLGGRRSWTRVDVSRGGHRLACLLNAGLHRSIERMTWCNKLGQRVDAPQRGYVLTGGETQLAQYQAANNRVALSIEALRGLTKDSPGQQERLDALEPLIGQQLDLLAKSIEERRGQGFDLNQQAVATSRAQELTDRIQKEVLSMADEEDKVFANPPSERKEAAAKRTLSLLLIGNLLALVIAASALYRADTESVLRAAADEELRKSTAWQEFRLQVGTKGLPATHEGPTGHHLIQTSGAK
jgi:CHASE3 domain sensor protein